MALDEKQTFLRWAGGKRRLVSYLKSHAPTNVVDRVYREPFLGGGSVFLGILPGNAVLSDRNRDLIETFRHVRDNPDLVSKYLRQHAIHHSEAYYYRVREIFNSTSQYSAAQASRFIYLNRTCYNGIFRVNLRGEYNVPSGRLRRPKFPSIAHLRWVANAMKTITLQSLDFKMALEQTESGDFLYVDPPYPPLNGTSYFSHYTAERFSDEEQRLLAKFLQKLSDRGCLIMVSNADTSAIRDLYRGFKLTSIPVTRFVSCKNKKHAVQELLITNY